MSVAKLQVEPEETLHLSAETQTEVFIVGLPPVVVPSEKSQEFDYVEITDAEQQTAQVTT
jgi:hypothetical protein